MKKKKLFSEIPYIKNERLVLHEITEADADGLEKLRSDDVVYEMLPTFLFERKYEDINQVIDRLYDECLKVSIVLGIYLQDEASKDGETFCGIAEMYGFRDDAHKISVGYRVIREFWGMGIATEALGLMLAYLMNETDIEIITASTMLANAQSARVLEKNDFLLVVHDVPEDWGYEEPTAADKWIR